MGCNGSIHQEATKFRDGLIILKLRRAGIVFEPKITINQKIFSKEILIQIYSKGLNKVDTLHG